MSVKNKRPGNSVDHSAKKTPERQVGHFNTAGNTGISVDVEVQLGVDLKDQKMMSDFIAKFEKARNTEKSSTS